MPVSITWNGEIVNFNSNDIESLRLEVGHRFGLSGTPFSLLCGGIEASTKDLEESRDLTISVTDESLTTLEQMSSQLNNRKWFLVSEQLENMRKDIALLTSGNKELSLRCEALEQTVEVEKGTVRKLEASLAAATAKGMVSPKATVLPRRKSQVSFVMTAGNAFSSTALASSSIMRKSPSQKSSASILKSALRSATSVAFGETSSTLTDPSPNESRDASGIQSVLLQYSSSGLELREEVEELKAEVAQEMQNTRLGLERDLMEVQVALEASIANVRTTATSMMGEIDLNAVEINQVKKKALLNKQPTSETTRVSAESLDMLDNDFNKRLHEIELTVQRTNSDLNAKVEECISQLSAQSIRVNKIKEMCEEFTQLSRLKETQDRLGRLEQNLTGGVTQEDLEEIHLAILQNEERDASRKKGIQSSEAKLLQFQEYFEKNKLSIDAQMKQIMEKITSLTFETATLYQPDSRLPTINDDE